MKDSVDILATQGIQYIPIHMEVPGETKQDPGLPPPHPIPLSTPFPIRTQAGERP